MTKEEAKLWWHGHRSWAMLIILCLCALNLGYILGRVESDRVYMQATAKISDAYTNSLASKDALIARMAQQSANVAVQSSEAAQVAASTANVAVKVVADNKSKHK